MRKIMLIILLLEMKYGDEYSIDEDKTITNQFQLTVQANC